MSSQAQREAVARNQAARVKAGETKVSLWMTAETRAALERIAAERGLGSITRAVEVLAAEAVDTVQQ